MAALSFSYSNRHLLEWGVIPRRRLWHRTPTASAGGMKVSGLISGWGRSPGGGHGNPLQYSCLEDPTDRGAWQATVHWVAKSRTQLKRLSTHPHTIDILAQFLASQNKRHVAQSSLKAGCGQQSLVGQWGLCGASLLQLFLGKQLALCSAFFPCPHPLLTAWMQCLSSHAPILCSWLGCSVWSASSEPSNESWISGWRAESRQESESMSVPRVQSLPFRPATSL